MLFRGCERQGNIQDICDRSAGNRFFGQVRYELLLDPPTLIQVIGFFSSQPAQAELSDKSRPFHSTDACKEQFISMKSQPTKSQEQPGGMTEGMCSI